MSGRVTRAPRGYTRIGALRPAAALAAVVLATTGAAALSLAQPAASVAGCRVSYTITDSWRGGFTTSVSVENLGSPIKDWTLAFSLPGDQTVTQRWNAVYSQSARNVTATNSSYNASLRTNQSTQFGFNVAYTTGTFPSYPSSFTLDATPCTTAVSFHPAAPVSAAPDLAPSPTPSASPTRDAEGFLYDASFRYAQYEIGGYAISNDEWGTGFDTQTLWVKSANDWGVTSTQPDTPNVKSYANIGKNMNVPLNSLSSATSSFNETNPAHGNWESAYDIWLNGTGIEVMAWTYVNGSAQPLGDPANTVTLDGNTWTLYVGNNGHNPTYSFVRQGNETSGTVDLLGLLKYLENTGGYFANPTLSSIQYGWEITGTGNEPTNFTMNDYSASTS
jgi:Cellulose binding domain/Glycosyl hydrolase family 12